MSALLKGPDVDSSDPGPRGPNLKEPIFNLFWAPGALPNRCALKFHDGGTYFRNFWWHGMKILILDLDRPVWFGSVYFSAGSSSTVWFSIKTEFFPRFSDVFACVEAKIAARA